MTTKNPLRYPGAKSKLYSYIHNLLIVEEKIDCTFYEPFAGSASLSLLLLENKIINRAIINEKDPLLYYFWISVFNHTDRLIELIENTDVTIENWHEFAKYKDINYIQDKSVEQIGYAGLFLNRTNFSGILKANPLGGLQQLSDYKIDCRFNKDAIIKSIKNISEFRNYIDVYNEDAIVFMKKHLRYKRNKKTFVYIDPPYFKEGPGLYRYFYNYQQHLELSKYIKAQAFPWLISYDDAIEIRKMYNRKTCVNIYLDYSVKTSKKGKELLISNMEIPPMDQDNQIILDIG